MMECEENKIKKGNEEESIEESNLKPKGKTSDEDYWNEALPSWEKIRERIRRETEIEKYEIHYWLKKTKRHKDDNCLMIELVTEEKEIDIAREKYRDIIKQIIFEESGKDYRVKFR